MTDENTFAYRNPAKAVGFAQVWHVVTLDPEVSDAAKITFHLYLMYAQQRGACWPSSETIAQQRGKSTMTITRHNEELEMAGYITRKRRWGKTSLTIIEDIEDIPRLQDLAKQVLGEREDHKNVVLEHTVEDHKNVVYNTTKMWCIIPQKCGAEEEQQKKNNRRKDAVVAAVLSEDRQAALDVLTNLGVDPPTARKLAGECDPDQVTGWVGYAQQAQGLDSPAAFVVSRLRASEPAPTPTTEVGRDQADRRRFIEGDFAEYVQH